MKPLDFPLLSDENIIPDVVAGLRSRGCDLRTAWDEQLIGRPDVDVLERAINQVVSSSPMTWPSVAPPEQMFVTGAADITAADSEPLDDVRNDVFVCEEWEIERLHAVILSSHVCSPLSASAAYRNAAARPSGVS